ncbi:hypothetical protein [Alkalibacillus aidingensis]|uniref:hypothetical protein n=1 Tax=Alkalibacillus aidingensis TaxID=2747607 RepID=UPI0016614274|nr:hypothetical protein [Alkalibacillus aidingensis]
MKYAFTLMFWGFIIVFLEIFIISIDISPDPIGFFMIAVGLYHLESDYPIAKRGGLTAFILAALSTPSVFIANNDLHEAITGGWFFYSTALTIMEVILVYFILKLMIEICKEFKLEELQNKYKTFLNWYVSVFIIVHLLSAFTLNVYSNTYGSLVIIFGLISLVFHIVFLVYLFKFRQIEENNHYDTDLPDQKENVNE